MDVTRERQYVTLCLDGQMQSYPIYLSPVILVSIPVVNGYLKKKEKTNEKNEKRI